MGITHNFINLTEMFNTSNTNKIVVNDMEFSDTETEKTIQDNIMTTYAGDIISTVPTCSCPGREGLFGRLNLGRICPTCGTKVQESYENIDSNIWLRSIFVKENAPLNLFPTGEIPFISPAFWNVFTDLLYKQKGEKSRKVDILLYLTDSSYILPRQQNALSKDILNVMQGIVNNCLNGKRSYIEFINNIDKVFEYVINHKHYNKISGGVKATQEENKLYANSKRKQLEMLYEIVKESIANKDGRIFTTYIPIISKHVFIMESTARNKIVNLKSAANVSVVKTWLKLCRDIHEREELNEKPITAEKIGKVTAKVIHNLAKLYSTYARENLYQKQGIFRKHLYGARVPFTGRAVITSIKGKHDRKGLDIPWSMGLTVFMPHIMNKLLKLGYSMKDAMMLINCAYYKHSDIIENIFKELIEEAPDKKIYCIIQRNPSLLRGSANLVYIRKFKTDIDDHTVGFSQLIVKAGNGDYDGDCLNLLFLLDKKMVDLFKPFDTDYSNMHMDHPGSIAKHLTLLGPGNSILLNYLKDKDPAGKDIITDNLQAVSVKVDKDGKIIK